MDDQPTNAATDHDGERAMTESESDPTGAFRGGSAGLEDDTPGVDEAERDVITSGTAATSEVADPEAQSDAEREGNGTPRPG